MKYLAKRRRAKRYSWIYGDVAGCDDPLTYVDNVDLTNEELTEKMHWAWTMPCWHSSETGFAELP